MSLGTDLLLLAVDQPRNRMRGADDVDVALMGAAIIELALAGRIAIDAKRIYVRDGRPIGQALLDPVLASFAAASEPPSLQRTVARSPYRQLRADHLAALETQGAVRVTRRPVLRVLRVTEVVLLDPLRRADVRARLDHIAGGQPPVEPRDRALAGLANACRLTGFLYPGSANRKARTQLKRLTNAHPARTEIDAAIDATAAAVDRTVTARHSSSG